MAEIKIRIDKKGETHIEVDGVSGMKCADLTRAFEDALGTKVDVQMKPEYYVELDEMQLHAGTED